jgi:hypothetical protein
MASVIRPGIPPRKSADRAARPLVPRDRNRDRAQVLNYQPRPATSEIGRSALGRPIGNHSHRQTRRLAQQIGPRLAAVRPTVKALPDRPLLPAWMRSLLKIQKTSVGLAVVLATATVGVYGWSVYSQQLWGKEYNRLQQLRHQERQLTASSEMLKHDIAKHVNAKELGLVPQSAEQTIFLKPAPERKPAPQRETAPPAPPAPPLGY